MKATLIPTTDAPDSIFVLAIVNGVQVLRRASPDIVGAQGLPGTDGTNGIDGVNGIDGTNGTSGTNGTVLRNGSGAPSNGLGADGDYYLDDDNGDLYKKTAGVYAVVANLKGPAGTFSFAVLPYAGTVNIDFSGPDYLDLTLAGDVIFTTSNLVAPKSITVFINADASIRNFTFPAWRFVCVTPTSIAASKVAALTITARGVLDSQARAAYAVEP